MRLYSILHWNVSQEKVFNKTVWKVFGRQLVSFLKTTCAANFSFVVTYKMDSQYRNMCCIQTMLMNESGSFKKLGQGLDYDFYFFILFNNTRWFNYHWLYETFSYSSNAYIFWYFKNANILDNIDCMFNIQSCTIHSPLLINIQCMQFIFPCKNEHANVS